MFNSNASLIAAIAPSQFTCRSEGIYHSILSSWDIPLRIILMGYTTPYYPHAFSTLLSSWQDNPPLPIQLYITTYCLSATIVTEYAFCLYIFPLIESSRYAAVRQFNLTDDSHYESFCGRYFNKKRICGMFTIGLNRLWTEVPDVLLSWKIDSVQLTLFKICSEIVLLWII